MKNVCIITSVHNPSDVRIFYRQALSLLNAGYYVSLIAPCVKSSIIDGINVIGFKPSKWRIGRLLKHKIIFYLAQSVNADVYHLHDPDLLLLGLKIKRKLKVPVIYDSHEDYPLSVISDKYYIPRVFQKVVALFTDILEQYLAKKMNGVIAVYQHRLEKISRLQQTKLLLPNYPPLDRFKLVDLTNKNLKKILYLGSLSQARGDLLLIELMKNLKHTDPEFTLEIIGFFDNEEMEHEFLTKILQEELNNILYHGRLKFDQVPVSMAGIGIGLITWLPTRQHLEAANPNKMFEYMASSMLVVAPDYGVFKEIIEKNNCGVLFDINNVADLVEKVLSVSQNPKMTFEMMNKARMLFEDQFNWNRLLPEFLKFYSEILSSNSN